MAFVREKRKGASVYYELVENERVGIIVRQKVLKYFPSRTAAVEYCKEHGIKVPTESGIIDKATAKRLEDKLEKLESLRPLPENTLKSLREKFEVEMTYNSNAIEGNRLSLKETYLVLMKGITIRGKSVQEHLEATNHKEALELLEKMVKKNVTIEDVLELHAVILDKIDPKSAGFFRHEQVYITESKHVPPKWREVPELMRGVVKELNSPARGAAAVESAVRVHHLVAWIHPFTDGNGRLSRLLCNLRLMRAGFPPVVLKKKSRIQYYDALEIADDSDLRPLAGIVARDLEEMLDLYISAAG